MDVEFLRSLVAVVDAGSIAEAARRENLTAAALGQRIRTLERELGAKMVEKVGIAAKPTRDCEVLLPFIRTLIEDADSLKDRLDATGMTGHLRMGAISTELGETIPHVLDALRTACPQLRLHVIPGTSQQLYEGLSLGALDLAVTVRPDFALPKSRHVTVLKQQRYFLLTPRGMQGTLADLVERHPFIRYDSRSWGGEKIETYLKTLEIKRNILCDIDSLETIAVMVGNGMGVSVVPEWSGIDLHRFRLNTAQMPPEAGSREICVIHNLPSKLPKVIKLILEICQTHASAADA